MERAGKTVATTEQFTVEGKLMIAILESGTSTGAIADPVWGLSNQLLAITDAAGTLLAVNKAWEEIPRMERGGTSFPTRNRPSASR